MAAHREETEHHAVVHDWLEARLEGPEPVGVPSLVLSGFLRLVTLSRAWSRPSRVAEALAFAETVRAAPAYLRPRPGPRHWTIFAGICRATNATGNRAPDAYLAALAIESGSTWITFDRGLGRYPDLRWRTPLDAG